MPGAPLSDREVPIGVARTSDLVNAWLDGDISESQVIGTESARTVDFWKRLDRDLETRRAMTTPAHLQQQIMNALPEPSNAKPAQRAGNAISRCTPPRPSSSKIRRIPCWQR